MDIGVVQALGLVLIRRNAQIVGYDKASGPPLLI
jgi:hypothetical protein